jgi:ATP-dependent Zn protease
MPEEQNEIIKLLKKNNELLEQLLKMKKKEHRAQTWRSVFHLLINLLPFLLILAVVYYLFTLINENIQAMQANINTLKEFMLGLVPDFSGVGDRLNEVWRDVNFWD